MPVGSKAPGVTAPAMQALFPHIAEGGEGHVLLAIVDASGMVSLVRMFSYLQAPFEGPEALPQQAAGQAGAGASDSE